MTTEEKAKAYDEALERAKSMIDDLRKGEDIFTVSDLESMFPELKESEDERIRKWIIEEFKIHYDFESPSLNPMVEKALAWLEKQKEQKPEWSEEDEAMRDNILRLLSCVVGTTECDSNPSLSTSYLAYQKEIDWLKSLRPQPRKKIYQAAKHDLAIRFMNYLDENRPEGKMSLSEGECGDIDKAFKENDWAKIMRYVEKYRPSWKPSEGQMKALEYASHGWKELEINVLPNKALQSLYNDLRRNYKGGSK